MKKICTCICFIFITILVFGQATPCASTCTQPSAIDNCAVNATSLVSDFKNGILQYSPGNCTDGLCAGSIWRFSNISVSGTIPINATVTIDGTVNTQLEKIDNDAATDLNADSKASLFAPLIKPDISLNGTDRKGYVQFTVRFFLGNVGDGYSLLLNLSNLSVYQYDLDGNNAGNINIGAGGSWFRETASLKLKETSNPEVQFDAATELTSNNFSDGADQWVGSIGGLCNKAGLSVCGQSTMAGKFSKPQYAVTFRLGYDYNAGGDIGQPVSDYGVKFGCFYVPGAIQLPVNLYEFTAKRNSSDVQLNWATTYEQMNQGFRIQRKTNESDFEDISFVPSQAAGGNSQIKLRYHYTDLNNFKGVSQYRIIQTDLENRIRVSEVRSVPGESIGKGILIYPNPATGGNVTVIFDDSNVKRDAILMNVFGQRIKQWNDITSNTLVVDQLIPGIYNFRITNKETGEIQTGKFAVAN